MTPYSHPILPLIFDSNLAAVAMKGASLPNRFFWPVDAIAQVQKGVQLYQDHFGVKPRGMWPGEGSVAQQIVGMVGDAGLTVDGLGRRGAGQVTGIRLVWPR